MGISVKAQPQVRNPNFEL